MFGTYAITAWSLRRIAPGVTHGWHDARERRKRSKSLVTHEERYARSAYFSETGVPHAFLHTSSGDMRLPDFSLPLRSLATSKCSEWMRSQGRDDDESTGKPDDPLKSP
jgi:hypothetical protein